MIEGKQRVVWIDIMKCIGIVFIVIYHAGLTHGSLYGVECFAVPLFFFVSGYLFNPDITLRNLLKRGFNSLLKPYLFTVILISIIYIIFKDRPFFLWYPFWIILGNGPNLPKLALHLWFLPSLFATMVFVWFMMKYFVALKYLPIIQCFFICILFICGYFFLRLFWEIKIPGLSTETSQFLISGLMDNPTYPKAQLSIATQFIVKGLPWSLDTVFITSAFFVTGYAVKKNKIEAFFHKGIFALIMIVIFCAHLYFFDYQFDISLRQYDHLLLLTVQIFAGIYVCMYLSNIIGNWNNIISKVLEYIGKTSLIIFIFHPSMMRLVSSLILAINIPNSLQIAILPILAAGIGLPLLLNYLLLERLKFFRYWYYAR